MSTQKNIPRARARVFHFAGAKGTWFTILFTAGLACIFAAIGYFADRFGILYLLPVGICLVGVAFSTVIRSNLRKRARCWTALLTVLVFLLPTLVDWLLRRDCYAFAVSTLASAYSSKRTLDRFNFWYEHDFKSGPTIFPVQELVYFEIVNLQSHPSTVKSYSVALRTSLFGRVEMTTMNLQYGQLFSGPISGTPLKQNTLVIGGDVLLNGPDVVSGNMLAVLDLKSLDRELANHPIQPHETVQGWAAFDIPVNRSPFLSQTELEFLGG